MKGINYLAIQLQLNVEDAKRISKKHWPFIFISLIFQSLILIFYTKKEAK
jgi:hypothetical protein